MEAVKPVNDDSQRIDTIRSKKAYKALMSPELTESLIYNEEKMRVYIDGIVQNIRIEMDKQNVSMGELARVADVDPSHMSRVFNGTANIGLATVLKISYALKVSPGSLFPNDFNQRKTNGQRFDDITKEMDVRSCNFLLNLCADYVCEWSRIKSSRANEHAKK